MPDTQPNRLDISWLRRANRVSSEATAVAAQAIAVEEGCEPSLFSAGFGSSNYLNLAYQAPLPTACLPSLACEWPCNRAGDRESSVNIQRFA